MSKADMWSSTSSPPERFPQDLPTPAETLFRKSPFGNSIARRKYVIALLAGSITFAAVRIIDYFLAAHGLPAEVTYLDDTIVGLLVAFLIFTVERSYELQRRRVLELERLVDEMNHHIRNALQSIAYLNFTNPDRDSAQHISAATRRIEWTLNTLLADTVRRVSREERDSRKVS